MKKYLFIISLMLIVVSKLNAQIEEISAEQYAPKTENVTKAPIEYLSKDFRSYGHLVGQRNLGRDIYPCPFNLMGQQLYCPKEMVDVPYQISSDGQRTYPIVAMTISEDGTIGIKKLKKGTYYNVTNIICGEEEYYNEFISNLLTTSKYSNDTIHYYDSNGKEQIYKFQFKSSKLATEPVRTLLYSAPHYVLELELRTFTIYELTDIDGLRYYIGYNYIGYESDIPYHQNMFKRIHSGLRIEGMMVASICDFISVDTYNYIKAKYEKKDLVSEKYYQPTDRSDTIKSEKYVYHIEKVGIENGAIVLLSKRGPDYDEVKTFKYVCETLDLLDSDTVCRFNHWGYLRTEVDSILDKKYQEKQAKEAAAREEKAKQKEEYVKKYGAKFAECIMENKVCAGMTKEMCKISMGTPDNTQKSSTSMGVVETWTYSRWYPFIPYTVVTFLNNKVTSVEEYESSPF